MSHFSAWMHDDCGVLEQTMHAQTNPESVSRLPVDSDSDEALKTEPIETIPAGPGELMSCPSGDEWSITSSNYK